MGTSSFIFQNVLKVTAICTFANKIFVILYILLSSGNALILIFCSLRCISNCPSCHKQSPLSLCGMEQAPSWRIRDCGKVPVIFRVWHQKCPQENGGST